MTMGPADLADIERAHGVWLMCGAPYGVNEAKIAAEFAAVREETRRDLENAREDLAIMQADLERSQNAVTELAALKERNERLVEVAAEMSGAMADAEINWANERKVLSERAERFREIAEMVDRAFRMDDVAAMKAFGNNVVAHLARRALLDAYRKSDAT